MIPSVSHKHSGIYQCLATNDLGTTYEFAMVTVTSGNETANFGDRDDYDGNCIIFYMHLVINKNFFY